MRGYTAKVGLDKSRLHPLWRAGTVSAERLNRMQASINRTTARIAAIDAGGLLPVVSQTFNASNEPEPVLTPEQAMTALIRMTEDMGLYDDRCGNVFASYIPPQRCILPAGHKGDHDIGGLS